MDPIARLQEEYFFGFGMVFMVLSSIYKCDKARRAKVQV
jgi:hypothetical protein